MEQIKLYIKKIPVFFKNASQKGFFHILFGNTLVKFISFFSAALLPDILSKAEYGNLGFVDNILNYILLVNALGLANAILRFCSLSEDKNEKEAVLRFCLKIGLIFDTILVALMVPVILLVPLPLENARYPLFFALFIPLFSFFFDALTYYLRANYKNKEFSRISILFTFVSAAAQILLAWKFRIFGALTGRYLAYITAVIASVLIIKKQGLIETRTKIETEIDKKQKKAIMIFALGAMIANCFSLIMPLNEQFVISVLLKDEIATANYRAASLLPQNLQFITSSIIIFIYPYFAKNSFNGKWIWKKYKQLTWLLTLGMVVLALIAIIFTPFIIRLLYGSKYDDIIGLMRFMWITFGINAGLRMPAGNILAAIGEIRFNLIVSIFSSILHLGLDLLFISQMGISGAAYALTITYFISAAVSAAFLRLKCKQLEQQKEVAENE